MNNLVFLQSMYEGGGIGTELKTIGRMAGVELLEHHRSLYKEGEIDAGIENNQSYSGSGAA